MENDTPLLPVALRSTEITETDVKALIQKAEEMIQKGDETKVPPRKIPTGRPVKVKVPS